MMAMGNALTLSSVATMFLSMIMFSLVPDASTMAVVGRGSVFGKTHALMTVLGIVFGNVIFIVLTVLGLASIFISLGIIS